VGKKWGSDRAGLLRKPDEKGVGRVGGGQGSIREEGTLRTTSVRLKYKTHSGRVPPTRKSQLEGGTSPTGAGCSRKRLEPTCQKNQVDDERRGRGGKHDREQRENDVKDPKAYPPHRTDAAEREPA